MDGELRCPYCKGALTYYGEGRSEYAYQCDPCGAAVAPDEAAGTARIRLWDRQAARGIHQELPLAALRGAAPTPEEGA